MKKITVILSVLLIAVTLEAPAQTKKTKKQPKKTATVKKTPAPKTTTLAPKATTYSQPAQTQKTAPATTKHVAAATGDLYKTALGLKFVYGVSLTGKHFISERAALEAIIQYRDHSGLGSEFNLTALYEYHGNITGANGLRWYAGGGAYTGYFNYDNGQLEELTGKSSSFSIGITGVLGLEYKFKNIPLAISADWQPVYTVNGNSGFVSENGGIGIKYTF